MSRFSTFSVAVFLLFSDSSFVSAAQINLADRQWALLTVPANADEQTIESLIADDLPIDSLGTDWSIYQFDQQNQAYVAANKSDSLKQGEGFWIIQATGASVTIDVPDALPAGTSLDSDACVSANGCFPASLPTSESGVSWAISGAPYSQAISVGDIRVQSNQQACANGCTLSGAAELVYGNQWIYDVGSAEYRPLSGLASLQPWQAFWVATESSPASTLTLLIPSPKEGPGATIETHHESIPNPVFNSEFRVAASCKTASQACFWDNPSTWQSGTVPNDDTLVIVDGQVQIRDQNAIARSIGVYPGGKLTFATNANTQLKTADLLVLDGGLLHIGTENAPIGSAYRADIIFRDLPFDQTDAEQHLRGLLALDGTVRVFGHAFNDVFIRTALEPGNGDSQITLEQSAIEAGWRIGDNLVIPTSKQCYSGSEGCADETEDRSIDAISSDGLSITLNAPLQFDHPGARSHSGSLDYTPHAINKSRNVSLRSENPDGVRAHILFHGRADVDMRYASVQDLGRTDIRDLGSTNQKGRYPVHAHHLIGPIAAQSNGYQFTLIGNVVDFGDANREQNRKWGLSIHGSHYGLIDQNVIDHASGAALVAESGSEMGNLFRKNFVVRVIGGTGERTHDPDPGDRSKLGRAGTGFWFNGGGRNFYESNVVAAVAECIYCFGFKFDNVYNGDLLFPTSQGSDPHMMGGEIINADAVGLNNFVDNEAYAMPNGLTVWWECTFGGYPNDNCSSELDSFQSWHHHRLGYYGYPNNNMTLKNFVVRGDPSVLSSRYRRVAGMTFGDYMSRNVKIINADIQNVRTGILSKIAILSLLRVLRCGLQLQSMGHQIFHRRLPFCEMCDLSILKSTSLDKRWLIL